MLEPLCHIINVLFDKGCVPDQLKISNVVPIFLNGDAKLIANYRLISVLPVFSKIFYFRLTKYISLKTTSCLTLNLGLKRSFYIHGFNNTN